MSHPSEMLVANTRAAAALRPDVEFVSLATEAPNAMDADQGVLADAVIAFLSRIEAKDRL